MQEDLRARGTAKAKSIFQVPEVDKSTIWKGTSEIDELRCLIHMQHLDLIEMKQKLARASSNSPSAQMDKVYLGSLSPMEYFGEGDFDDYLSQF